MSVKVLLLFSTISLIIFLSSSSDVPQLRLNNGLNIPAVGFGCWKITYARYNKILGWLLNDYYDAAKVIYNAIKSGYRHLDSAYIYDIERPIGIALKKLFAENYVKREDIFITTKVWNTFHRRDRVVKNLKISMLEMNISYIDLALIHFPTGFQDGDDVWPTYFPRNLSNIPRKWEKDSYLETWMGLEDAYEQGIVKSIGVANFNIDQLKKIIDMAKIKPVISQVESNPYYKNQEMLEFCRQNNIVMTAYSPLRQAKELLNDRLLNNIGRKYNKTAAQVALRWNLQRDVVIIPSTTKWRRMKENLDIFDFELNKNEVDEINSIPDQEKNMRIFSIRMHPDYPGDI